VHRGIVRGARGPQLLRARQRAGVGRVLQLATFQVPDARVVMITPYDQSTVTAIEKSIRDSDLGVNPSNDGKTIRVTLPQLTEQRRKELIKVVQKRVEDGRIAIRNVRRDASDQIKRMEKNKDISADEVRRAQDQLQKLTDTNVAVVEKHGRDKEQELMEV